MENGSRLWDVFRIIITSLFLYIDQLYWIKRVCQILKQRFWIHHQEKTFVTHGDHKELLDDTQNGNWTDFLYVLFSEVYYSNITFIDYKLGIK